jgi:hypothetical protein
VYNHYVLQTTSNSRIGIPIDFKEPANGFFNTKISGSGKRVVLQVFFGYLRIQDAENPFYRNLLSTKTSKVQKLAPLATSSLKMTMIYKRVLR